MNPQMTEILIGKFLDSEITPAEKQLLDKELQRNPQANKLLQELQQLHHLTQQTITAEIAETGDFPEDIFARAAQVAKRTTKHRPISVHPALRLAGSLAAGFVLGMGAFFLYTNLSSSTKIEIPTNQSPSVIAPNPAAPDQLAQAEAGTIPPSKQPSRRQRSLDWYVYPAPSGSHYLIENYRENDLSTASYHGNL